MRALVVLLVACSHPQKPPMSNPCRIAIEAFASADPAKLVALPTGCTVAEARAVLSARAGATRGSLGDARPVDVHYFSSTKLADVHAWVEGEHVILLDADLPPGDAAGFAGALGVPEAMLDYPYMGAVLERAEQVWPTKGVVVVVGSQRLLRFGVFAPTTLDDYQARLRRVEKSTDD